MVTYTLLTYTLHITHNVDTRDPIGSKYYWFCSSVVHKLYNQFEVLRVRANDYVWIFNHKGGGKMMSKLLVLFIFQNGKINICKII